jgi:hypothetical protein
VPQSRPCSNLIKATLSDWRRNEIFYISSDQKLMAVEVSTDPIFEEKSVAKELFPAPPGSFVLRCSPEWQ